MDDRPGMDTLVPHSTKSLQAMIRTTSSALLITLVVHSASSQEQFAPARTGFVENKGQLMDQNGQPNHHVRYLFRSPGLNVQVRRDGFSYDTWQASGAEEGVPLSRSPEGPLNEAEPAAFDFHRVDISFPGSSGAATLVPSRPGADHFNFYNAVSGQDGAIVVRHFEQVGLLDLYPGIDLVFHVNEAGEGRHVEYDFVVHPGADLSALRMRITGAPARINADGALQMSTAFGEVVEEVPMSWFELGKQRRKTAVDVFAVDGTTFGFRTADGSAPPTGATLVIDPVPSVNWSTMYGGESLDSFLDVVLEANNNTLVSGFTHSPAAIATAGAHLSTYAGGQDAMLVKFNSSGVRQWATYYGGTGSEAGTGVSVDASGNVFMCGGTASSIGIATAGAHKTTLSGARDGYLAKFNAAGVRQWCTYYGGSGVDNCVKVSCDGAGDPGICGGTESLTGIATAGAPDISYGGNGDAFIAKFNSNGVRQWGTYLGGSGEESSNNLSNDGTFFYLVGGTTSTSGIALGATHQTSKSGGLDAYLVKYTGLGAKAWATYYGGAGNDYGLGCLAEPQTGRIYICGSTTSSSGIASAGAHDATYNGPTAVDPFLAKINNTGAREWGTYYGGTSDDWFEDICIGYTGRIYVSGYTLSTTGIATNNTPQTTLTESTSAFLTRWSTTGSRNWGTYFNGSANWMYAKCAARSATVILAGDTRSQTITTPGCHQPDFGGGGFDAYVVSFNDPLFVMMETEDDAERPMLVVRSTDGALSVDPWSTAQGPAEIVVHDATGRMLGTWTWADPSTPLRIRAGNIQPGAYTMRATTAADQRSARFVVEQ